MQNRRHPAYIGYNSYYRCLGGHGSYPGSAADFFISLDMNDAVGFGKILLVAAADENIARLVKSSLEKALFAVDVVGMAASIAGIDVGGYSLVLVDATHQTYSGLDLVRDLKANPLTAKIPVIVLGRDDSSDSIINALDTGADDYVAKPFSMRELLARIYAVCRRHPGPDRGQGRGSVS